MFNKPAVFGRNDPVTRRDSTPVLGSSSVSGSSNSTNDRMAVKNTLSAGAATVAASPVVSERITPVEEQASASPVSSSAASSNEMGARLIVGPDVKLKGAEILDCDTLVVEGRVEATMDSRVIRIAEKGSFAGKVSIDIAEIHGTFEGELTARSQLIIHSTGRVSGTIRYGKLVADEGGELCGDINVLSDKPVAKAAAVVEPFTQLNSAAG